MATRLTRRGEHYVVEHAPATRHSERIAARDRRMFRMLLNGYTFRRIAAENAVSIRTVERRIASIPPWLKIELKLDEEELRGLRVARVAAKLERSYAS